MGGMPESILGAEHAALWLSLIESRLGMVLPPLQHRLFENRVMERMQSKGMDMQSYYLLAHQSRSEWQQLAEALVVNETAFFRHQPSYELVRRFLSQTNQETKLWSLGCSTGEEPWSLAMYARAYGLKNSHIIASDVSEKVLRVARRGVYSARRAESIPEDWRNRFGSQLPTGEWRVGDSLRSAVYFHKFNLMDVAKAPFRDLHLIYCQNVLIYFRKFDRRDILDALVMRLQPGGMLILGPGEMPDWNHAQMKRASEAGTLAYERI